MSNRAVMTMPTVFAAAFEEFAVAVEERVFARLAERLGAVLPAPAVPAQARPELAPEPAPAVPVKRKAKRHIQMCPVPRCKQRAAPVFGMVCANHKDIPKATVAKYREQRRNKAAPKVKAKAKPKK